MNTVNNVWSEIIDKRNIRQAIYNASEDKYHLNAIKIVNSNVEFFVNKLQKMLINGTYVPSDYKKFRIKADSGKERDICKVAFFPDRIIQHLIALVMLPRWDKALTADTYSSWKNRGICCKIKKYSLAHKLKRSINSFQGRIFFCLKIDIKKCYASVRNSDIERINRKYCSDEKLLDLMNRICYKTEGLPIGNYISQLWINILLSELDRYCKQEIGVKHYFRFMDDIVIFSEDKAWLHQVQWHIRNFLWYEFQLELNNKRQVFPVTHKRAIDYAGFKFYPTHTLLRNRNKKAFVRKRHNPKSVASYYGMVVHSESAHLYNTIVNKDNRNMKFDNLDIEKIERPFDGKKIKIKDLVNRNIRILDFRFQPSKREKGKEFVQMQIEVDGGKRFVQGGFKYIMRVLKQVPLPLEEPIKTVIKSARGYYFEGGTLKK